MTFMSDIEWNSVTVGEEEKPVVSVEEIREMAQDLNPDDFDEDVQQFLRELMTCDDLANLKQAATLLLQDEIDLPPDLAQMGVEPDEELIRLLLVAGADPNVRNPYGQLPLHLAAFYGYEAIVDMLLAAGADVKLRNQAGVFAYEVAATPSLADKIEPPDYVHDNEPLPPEIEDADWEDPEEPQPASDSRFCDCGGHHGHIKDADCRCGRHAGAEEGDHCCGEGHHNCVNTDKPILD